MSWNLKKRTKVAKTFPTLRQCLDLQAKTITQPTPQPKTTAR